MDVNNENNLYDFLIKSMDALCIKQKLTQIPYMNCAVLIGTNKDLSLQTTLRPIHPKG